MMNRSFLIAALGAVLSGMLAACGGSGDELRQWMADTRKEMRPVTPKVNEPKTFQPFLYRNPGEIDPFDPAKVASALRKLSSQSTSGLSPDLSRRKEPLESFPIDTISMVGTLQGPKLRYALLRADGLVYQVKVGNYVGQNFGIVTAIGENTATLKEVVQDAAGEWVERVSTLQLQESKK